MKQRTKLMTYSALMCALIIVSTLFFRFTIPFTEIMVTTQVFFILLCGQLLPPLYCLYSVGAYIALGLAGLPVFSAVSGPVVVLTPSFGYLLGFVAASALTAYFRQKNPSLKGRLASCFIGLAVIYAVALPYIAVLKGAYMKTPVSFWSLASAYCLVFLPADIVKAVLAAFTGLKLQKPLGLNAEGEAQ